MYAPTSFLYMRDCINVTHNMFAAHAMIKSVVQSDDVSVCLAALKQIRHNPIRIWRAIDIIDVRSM